MPSIKQTLATTALLLTLPLTTAQSSGTGTTTRYWDCCKPSCAWSSSTLTSPVLVCDASDSPLSPSAGASATSGCAGGSAYMCSSQSPWAVSPDLAYGFAAVSSANSANCCSCYKLTFTDTAIKGKSMIVQATNTGGDVGSTQFDLAMPGGGFGMFDGCSTEWGATDAVWGARYGGPSSNTCAQFPKALQAGCGFRWDWMEGADNPAVEWETVDCPAEIVAKSGCQVAGSSPVVGVSSSAVAAAGTSSAAVVSTSSVTAQAPASSESLAAEVSSSSSVVEGAEQSTAQGEVASVTSPPPAASATASASLVEHGTVHKYPAHRFRPLGTAKSAPSLSTAAEAEATGAADDDEQDECEL